MNRRWRWSRQRLRAEPQQLLAGGRSIRRVKKRITRLERGYGKELKTFDVLTSSSVGGTGVISKISNMAQGDTSITREGLQIQPRSLQWKIYGNINAANTASDYLRYIIFIDKQQVGTLPTVAQLLEGDAATSFPEHDTRPRFKILRDMVIRVDAGGPKNFFRKGIINFKKGMRIWYSGTSDIDSSMAKNNIYVYMFGTETTSDSTMSIRTRLRFVDG